MNLAKKDFFVIIKTVIDYAVAILSLILLSPLIIILFVIIKSTGKGPVFYTQLRSGFLGKPFILYKFRSMYDRTEEDARLLSDKKDKRITPTGRFMRKHKLDEIPNLINVLKGEMSLVGPRPEQQYYIDQIVSKNPDYLLLQALKPGITSWGQVKYGYASNVDQMLERLEYDLFYLKNRSLWLDLKIVLYTIGIIFKGEGT